MNARVHPRVDAATISTHLRRREPVTDVAFDSLLSDYARARSRTFWSTVRAAQTAAECFRAAGATRVLDVGSGVGKLTSILSLDSGHRVWGVEQRPALVYESRRLAQRLDAEVVITEGGLETVDPLRFDGFYFFNPFAEHVSEDPTCYDLTVARSFDAYLRDARTVESWLRQAPIGTALVTLNGLGGRIPTSFLQRRVVRVNGNTLRLWTKTQAVASTDAYIEIEGVVVPASRLAELVASGGQVELDALVAALVAPPED